AQSMEVSLTLASPSEPLRELLMRHRDDLLEVLMVSELEVPDGAPSEAEAADMVPGAGEPHLLIRAVPSGHGKCARCWNLREGVGHNGAYPDLCPRCVRAVEEMKAG
ncbi:MAG: isoleucine--tRNA ligase, partial [Candidatus Brocadiae bacterium]|nr:isoleucine--tRNA ligase [Candidatus Brocadiia bacterium]